MESKENIASGVTVIRAEAPSNYHVAPRGDAPTQPALVPPPGTVGTINAGVAGLFEKKKKGRPRKYGLDGSVQTPISASGTPSVGNCSSGKRGRGRLGTSEAKQQKRLQMMTTGDDFEQSDGANFTPHVIAVNVGEDVTAKIVSFCQQGPRAICILSANGMVSNATLRQSDSSGGTLTYEGRFEIVNLCGSFTPTEEEDTGYRVGRLSVSLSSPNGQVVGGCVAGLLIAASPVQIIVGSFLPSMPPVVKPVKPKVQKPSSSSTPFRITNALPPPLSVVKESFNGQGHNNLVAPMQNLASPAPYQRENWLNAHAMQEQRISTTDINIPLHEGMQ